METNKTISKIINSVSEYIPTPIDTIKVEVVFHCYDQHSVYMSFYDDESNEIDLGDFPKDKQKYYGESCIEAYIINNFIFSDDSDEVEVGEHTFKHE